MYKNLIVKNTGLGALVEEIRELGDIMNFERVTIGILFAGATLCSPVMAQEPTSTEAGSSEVVQEMGLTKIQSFLASKGWTEGSNKGGKLFVSTGVGTLLGGVISDSGGEDCVDAQLSNVNMQTKLNKIYLPVFITVLAPFF